MENLVCLNCKYRFTASKMTETCPYCAKRAVEREKSADDLVNEIDSLLKD